MGFRMGKKIKESSTTAGGVAPVAQSMHTDKRSVVGQGIYGKTKGGNLFTGKKSSKKFVNSIAEAQAAQEGLLDIFKGSDNKKPKRVAVSTDDEEGKISFSDLGKNAMFDPNDKRITDDQRMFYEFMLSQKNKADLTDFLNVIQHYVRKYKEATRKEGGSNPLNSGRLKVLNYFERQLEKMPIKESDISEELLAKKLAQDFKSFKHPKDKGISKRSRDRDILPKQEFNEVAVAPAAQVAAKAGGSALSKIIPGVGLAAGGYDAYQRAKRGDYLGAGISALGGVTSLVPGIGTAASLGLTAAQFARDKARTGSFVPSDEEQIAAVAKDKADAAAKTAAATPAKTAALSTSQVSAATPAKPRAVAQSDQDPTRDTYNPASDPTLQAGNREVAAPAPSNFKQAFAAARQGGEGTFTYKGKEYNTQLAEQTLVKMKKIKPTIKQDKLSPHEKFKGSVKRAGYDMDAGANRLLKLLDKQASERAARDKEDVNEWVSRREEFNPQPAVSTMESAENTIKTFKVSLVDRLTDEPKTVTVMAASGEEAEAKAEKQHSGYDVRGSRKIAEGAKVDRMVKHIEKSERDTGKSKKEAENIAWATANKRGYLDNKNKKKHVAEGRVKDLAMAIDELIHDGKTPGQIAKELDVPLMIVLKFKAEMDQMDKPVVAKGQLNEFDPGEERKGPFTLLAGDHNDAYEVGKFDTVEDAQEEVRFLMDADPKSARQQVFTILDRYEIKVWTQDPADEHDQMRRAKKIQFLKLSKKDIDEASFDSAEYDDEAGMAHNQLKTIARSVKGLMDTIDEGDNLPEWVQKKLALAEDHLVTIWDYLQSEKSDEVMEAHKGDTNFGSTVTQGSWVVYDGDNVKRFKSRDGAKAYAAKNGGKVASSEFYADNIQKQGVSEAQQCPECGGAAYDNEMIAEEKDACYSKVKSRYKVWPSAYASGALVRCRKVGAKNWGNKSKKK